MPFDPAWPQNGQNIDADRFRSQFAGIIELIGSGSGINAAQVDAVNTLPPGFPAHASVSVVGNTLHFTFELPQGETGSGGPPGADGADGPPGPPFASAIVDSVTTLDPGQPASVSVSFDGTNVHFTFALPRGNDGSTGPQGPPGEVTQAQLDAAFSGTSANTNAVSTLDTLFSDPDMEALRQKLNELILTARR